MTRSSLMVPLLPFAGRCRLLTLYTNGDVAGIDSRRAKGVGPGGCVQPCGRAARRGRCRDGPNRGRWRNSRTPLRASRSFVGKLVEHGVHPARMTGAGSTVKLPRDVTGLPTTARYVKPNSRLSHAPYGCANSLSAGKTSTMPVGWPMRCTTLASPAPSGNTTQRAARKVCRRSGKDNRSARSVVKPRGASCCVSSGSLSRCRSIPASRERKRSSGVAGDAGDGRVGEALVHERHVRPAERALQAHDHAIGADGPVVEHPVPVAERGHRPQLREVARIPQWPADQQRNIVRQVELVDRDQLAQHVVVQMPEVAFPSCAQRHRSWKERDRVLVDQPGEIVAEALGCRSGVELPVRQRLLDQTRPEERVSVTVLEQHGLADVEHLVFVDVGLQRRDVGQEPAILGSGRQPVGEALERSIVLLGDDVALGARGADVRERAHPGATHRRADEVLERLTERHGEPSLANPSPSVSQRSGLGLRRRRRYALGVACRAGRAHAPWANAAFWAPQTSVALAP